MSTEASKAAVRRFYEEVWDKGNTGELDALAAPELVIHERAGAVPYRERWKREIAAIRAGFGGIRVTLEDLIGEGDKAVSRWRFEGTHTGEFRGIAPTGKRTVLTGITVFRIQHGRVTECWNSADALGWMQLGAIPNSIGRPGHRPELTRAAGAGGPANGGHAVPTEENKAVIRRLFAEVFTAGDVAAVPELVAPDVLGHDATSAEPKRGLESVRQVAVLFRTAFPDLRLRLEDLIAEGDKVVARWTLRGTHRGAFMGVPATGKTAEAAGIVVYRLAGGKITEYWGSFDALGLFRQLGAIPEPADRAGS
ncbi:MAG: ester cyclase [Actinomycetes bacterium]